MNCVERENSNNSNNHRFLIHSRLNKQELNYNEYLANELQLLNLQSQESDISSGSSSSSSSNPSSYNNSNNVSHNNSNYINQKNDMSHSTNIYHDNNVKSRSMTSRPDSSDNVSRYLPQNQAIITTQDNWKISLANDIATHLLCAQDNMIGNYIFDFIDANHRHSILEKIIQMRDHNDSLIISGDIVPIVKLDGTKSSVSLWLKEKRRNENGNSVFIWILEEILSTTIKLSIQNNQININENLFGFESLFNTTTTIQEIIPNYNPTRNFFACRTRLNAFFPVMVGQHKDSIRITCMPVLTGQLTISRKSKTILSSQSILCKYLFGYSTIDNMPLSTILPQSSDLLDILEHDQLLEDGYVLSQSILKNILNTSQIYAIHQDGSQLDIDLQIKLQDDNYLLWISFNRDAILQKYGHVKATDLKPTVTRPNRSQSVHAIDLWPSGGNYSAQTLKTNIHDYEILDELGQGAYGFVKLAYLKKDPEKKRVVIKYVIKSRILIDCWTRDRKLGLIPAEIHVLHTLKKIPHINCSDMLDYFEDEDHYYIVSDLYGAGMDLFDYIELKQDGLSEQEIRSIFVQIVSAVKHLHDNRIIHRDIKDENIILDLKGGVRLIDFGSAAYLKEGKRYETFVGTLDYAAPEILKGETYTGPPQDIWACGTLLYTLIYRENPFYNIEEIMEKELRIPYILSEESIDLIKKMLNRNVTERLTIHQVLKHPWFQSK